jgi:hypothetical protein
MQKKILGNQRWSLLKKFNVRITSDKQSKNSKTLLKELIVSTGGITISSRTHSTVDAIKSTYARMSEANEQLKSLHTKMAEKAEKDPASASPELLEAIQDDIAEFEEIASLYNSINFQKIKEVTGKLNNVEPIKIYVKPLKDAESRNQNILSKMRKNNPHVRAAKAHMTVFDNIRSKK